jgi:hypothetical protein
MTLIRSDDECSVEEDCVWDTRCPFYRRCRAAVETDHQEGNCSGWEPYCPVCKEEAGE